MVLSKISLHGFKSFAKKVELRFDGSVTAVVGPNGCGKTNIVDAIRWGLGEQKASILRADRMENVIFGGAQSSRPLGMAEVSIHFNNAQHLLPIDYNEVVVTRRLYRSGESEYLLNKASVRLKDIQDLLMDTGIGTDAYSVIELKMVEDILSEKAEDRRKLLEEAAGVTKYKHRLKAAMRKLDATQNDFLRVNDIIREVERTVASLKRQVQRAKRYQVLQEQIKELESKRGNQLYTQIQMQIKPLKGELTQLKKQKEGRTTEITKEEADLESLRLQLVEREKALTEVREELGSIIERIHRTEGDIRVSKERISSLEDRIDRNNQEVKELKKRLDEQKTHMGVALQDRERLQVKITSQGRIFNNKKKELEVFQQGLNLKRLELNSKKKDIIDCLEKINNLSSEETRIRAKIDNNQGRLERLEEEDNAFRQTQERAQNERQVLEKDINKIQTEKERFTKARAEYAIEETELLNAIESAKEALYQNQSELKLQQGRLAFLRSIVESREGTSDGTKRLIQKKPEGFIGVLADLLKTESKCASAVDIGLGEATCYLVFEKAVHAFDALTHLKNMGGGKVSLIGLDRIRKLPVKTSRPELPQKRDIIGWADDLIECDKRIRGVVSCLLGDLLIVRDLESAKSVLETFSKEPFRVATLEGELVTDWGVYRTSDVSGKDGIMVGRLQRIRELEVSIKKVQAHISENEKQLKTNDDAFKTLLEKKKDVEAKIKMVEGKLTLSASQQAKVNFEWEKAEEGLRRNVEERQKVLVDIEKWKDMLETIRPEIDTLLEKREQIEEVINSIQNEVDRLESEEGRKEEEVHRLNLTVVRLSGEAKNLDYDVERSKDLIQEIENTIQQRSDEIVKAKSEISQCQKETINSEKTLVEDFVEKDKQEVLLHERDTAYQELKDKIQIKGKEVQQVRRDRDEASERIHDLEMKISELEHQVQSLQERLWESYEIKLRRISIDDEIHLEEVEEKIETLRRKIKSLGPVNMMALDEYEESKERLDFLCQQRDDLLLAEETLNETIQKINKTARQRFLNVFSEVRNNFKSTFSRFFQGGEADLRLPEGEDPLETQIEIIARPAGKHFRDLDLLSGGERALTAISLLFALYLVKPSPFCILDEIDAPLDDANINRFIRVLEEYAQKTQFIIVTHNKMTMRVAQSLYGVTMEEEGVSKIVSVKFEDNA